MFGDEMLGASGCAQAPNARARRGVERNTGLATDSPKRHSGRSLTLSLVVEPPPGAGLDEAQLPRLPTGRHAAVGAAMDVYLEGDALLVMPGLRRGQEVRRPLTDR
jgi:hypothetical protein